MQINTAQNCENILLALRELEAWEERKQKLVTNMKKLKGDERKEAQTNLIKINQQIKYYDMLTKDMKKEMKPTNIPDLLCALIGY